MTIRLCHVLHDHVEVRHGGQSLFRYVYEPATGPAPWEPPRPYFHPLRTLAGDEVTIYRPHDHPWHKGMAMTMAQLSGQNFWGRQTYVQGEGYRQLANHGRMQHVGWPEMDCDGHRAVLTERLHWVTQAEETWLDEQRRIAGDSVDVAAGCWALALQFRLTNVRGQPLTFGSPTTEGRPLAGYGGLFWRGPRSFQGGRVLAGACGAGSAGLEGPGIMGQAAPWLAYVGQHDGTCNFSTIVFLDQPTNPRHPTKWFVRNDPYAGVSCSFMFDERYVLNPGQDLVLDYRVLVATGAWSREQIETYCAPFQQRAPASAV